MNKIVAVCGLALLILTGAVVIESAVQPPPYPELSGPVQPPPYPGLNAVQPPPYPEAE
jgi:hypothetical protein